MDIKGGSADLSNSPISRVIGLSFRQRSLVFMVVGLATIFGLSALQRLPRNVYPDITIPVFTIVTENSSMAPEEIEMTITRPIESSLSGLPNVRRVRSQTTLGLSSVVVEFDINTEFWRARQFVTERLSQISAQLPLGTEAPTLGSATTRMAEVFEFAIEGDTPPAERREIAEWQIRYNLLNVPGVSEVLNMGGYLPQYKVTLDPNQLRAYGITVSEVEEAIRSGNENTSGGFVSTGPTEYTVRGLGRYESINDIRDSVVTVKNGTPIFLWNVAEVEQGFAIRRGIASKNGEETVIALVIKQPDADTVTVVAGVKEALNDIQATLPKGVRIVPHYDQTKLIHHSLVGVLRAILVGAVLVTLAILAFLGNIRGALIVALSLPVSVAIAGLFMHRLGVGLNTMSLGGLAIAVGIMVDASIIMVENIYLRMRGRSDEQNDPATRTNTAYSAATEVGRPIAFATMIIIAVFLPLYMMGGIEGMLFRPLAITVAAAMFISLLLSLTLTPILSSSLLRPRNDGLRNEEPSFLTWIKRGYVPALDWAFRRAGLVRALAVAVTVPALIGFILIGKNFMPSINEGSWLISAVTPSETSLEENYRITSHIENLLLKNPNVDEVIRRSGRAERAIGCVLPVNTSELQVNLKPRRELTDSPERILAEVRQQVEQIPGVGVAFSQPFQMKIDESLEGAPAPLQVKLFGPDIHRLTELGGRIRDIMNRTPGVSDVKMDQVSGVPQLQVRLNRQAAARYGVSAADVSELLRLAVSGEEVTQVWKDQRNYGVFVRFPEHLRNDPDAISNLLVDTPSGAQIPLSQVAELTFEEGPNVIWRESMSRRLTVDANIQGRDLSSVVADIKAGIDDINLPKDYFVVFGGHYQNQQRAARSLMAATLVALSVVFMLLYLALRRLSDALIILATLPDAFVGGILALLIARETLNVSSAVGFIALFGIAVQNGLVLLTQTRDFEAQGLSAESAIRQAAIGRLRPKLMTASCTILGVVPILMTSGVGAEIERPLAIVLVGGVITSTVFTLLALPTVYVLVERWKSQMRGSRWLKYAGSSRPADYETSSIK